jgi:hypothetical protein
VAACAAADRRGRPSPLPSAAAVLATSIETEQKKKNKLENDSSLGSTEQYVIIKITNDYSSYTVKASNF